MYELLKRMNRINEIALYLLSGITVFYMVINLYQLKEHFAESVSQIILFVICVFSVITVAVLSNNINKVDKELTVSNDYIKSEYIYLGLIAFANLLILLGSIVSRMEVSFRHHGFVIALSVIGLVLNLSTGFLNYRYSISPEIRFKER